MDRLYNYLLRVINYNPAVVLFELLVIGLVVWGVYRFLKGTRGARLLKGAVVILVALFVFMQLFAELLGLDRVKWLYENFLLVVALAMVIVFQPELRRALIRVGEARFFRSAHQRRRQMIDAVIAAVMDLSRQKIGALIAIERDQRLGAIVESGVRVEGRLTPDLLKTIFWPGSAMHDLGVVVRDLEIVAARCLFPIFGDLIMDSALGSRHRAALSLSHECDALILIVSEETGGISLAEHGRLHRNLRIEPLRNLLDDLLQQKTGNREPKAES